MKAKPKTTVGSKTEFAERLRFNAKFFSGLEVLEMIAIVQVNFLLH